MSAAADETLIVGASVAGLATAAYDQKSFKEQEFSPFLGTPRGQSCLAWLVPLLSVALKQFKVSPN